LQPETPTINRAIITEISNLELIGNFKEDEVENMFWPGEIQKAE
jgi:hypothetical protein